MLKCCNGWDVALMVPITLKAADTFGIIAVTDQYSHLVYPKICIQKQICEIVCSIDHRSCKRVMNQENTLVAQLYVLSDAYKRLQLIDWETTLFSKTMLLQKEPFPTMFYTIISFPLLPSKLLYQQLFWVISKSVQCLNSLAWKYSHNMIQCVTFVDSKNVFFFFSQIGFVFSCKFRSPVVIHLNTDTWPQRRVHEQTHHVIGRNANPCLVLLIDWLTNWFYEAQYS